MNTFRILLLALMTSVSLHTASAQTSGPGHSLTFSSLLNAKYLPAPQYQANMSLSHGHCQLPLQAQFTAVDVRFDPEKNDPLKIDFSLATGSISALSNENDGEWTKKMHSRNSFDAAGHPVMEFKCEQSFRIGSEWYQLNGTMTIKGKSQPASFRVRPIFASETVRNNPTSYVLDGRLDPDDFAINEASVGGEEDIKHFLYMNLIVAHPGC